MNNFKIPLSELIPTSTVEINEIIDKILHTNYEDLNTSPIANKEEKQGRQTSNKQAKQAKQAIEREILIQLKALLIHFKIRKMEDINLSRFLLVLDNPLPENMNFEFNNVIARAKPLIEHLTDNEKDSILLIIFYIYLSPFSNNDIFLLLESLHEYKKFSFKSILKYKKSIELTKAFSFKKKIIWADFLAIFALFEVLYAIFAWHSQYNEEFFNSPLGETLGELKLYEQCWLSILIDSNSVLTLAEELKHNKNNSSEGGKSPNKLTPINKKLRNIYFQKYSTLSNKHAALEMLNELESDENKTFTTDFPQETIEKWIAKWKKQNRKA